MATIALDATYTLDPLVSGIAVYSRRLIEALSELESEHHFRLCYRLSRFRRRKDFLRPTSAGGTLGPRFSVHYYQEPLTFWLRWGTDVFHSLAQRPPAFRFEREIVTIHDVFPLTGRDYSTPDFQRKFSRLLLAAAERAVRIITPSQYTADELQKHSNVDPAKIRVIPEGVSSLGKPVTPEEALQEREQLAGAGNIMILNVGILQARKNILNVLRAIELLPPRYRLVLAGGDGYGSESIHKFIQREGLRPRVVTLGHVETRRLPALYRAADVFLFPSLEEGFGLPVLEAMSYGLPVVAANASSLPEVGGEAALYADPHDPRDIAEKVRRAAEDVSLSERMTSAGLARAREFTWGRTAWLTLGVYNEVLGKG